MIDIINSQQCYTSPTMYWTIQYEYKREEDELYYRFDWKVWLAYSNSLYDWGLALIFYVDGAATQVTVKEENLNEYKWTKSGTTDWIKAAGNATGKTTFYVQLYDTSRKQTKVTSATYNLAGAGKPSELGTISDFNIGGSITIPITKHDDTFEDTLVISYDGTTVKTVSRITNNSKVSFTSAELSKIYGLLANGTSGTFTFTLTTRSDGVVIGTSEQTATGSISDSAPTFKASQISYWDDEPSIVAITGSDQYILQNKSYLIVKIGRATGNKGATITQYDVTVNGVTKSVAQEGSIMFGEVNTSQNTDITVVVTDSRGSTTTVSKEIKIIPYSAPFFIVNLERLNNYENETYLSVDATVSPINGKNTLAITFCKKLDDGSYTAPQTLGNREVYTTSCDNESSHVFRVTVTDIFVSVTKESTLPRGRFPLFIDTDKNAVGVNEFPSNGEALRVARGVACFDDGIVLKSATKSFKITVDDSGELVIEELY